MKTTDLTKIVKKALGEKYGFKNVSVKRGRGTASGWVEARVSLDKERPTCEMCPNYMRCYSCGEKYRNDRLEAEKIAYKAVNEAGLRFHTYYSDDGYGTERSEFLLDVKYN